LVSFEATQFEIGGQKTGEIEAFRALEIGVAKCHGVRSSSHVMKVIRSRMKVRYCLRYCLTARTFGKTGELSIGNASASRKREWITMMMMSPFCYTTKEGQISATFSGDWYLREGESRDKLGEWLKKISVRSRR
jgi:hypothetical protein